MGLIIIKSLPKCSLMFMIFDLVSHNLKFNGSVMNPCKKASCSHLCLLIPNGGFRCSCPEGSTPSTGAPDKCDAGSLLTQCMSSYNLCMYFDLILTFDLTLIIRF